MTRPWLLLLVLAAGCGGRARDVPVIAASGEPPDRLEAVRLDGPQPDAQWLCTSIASAKDELRNGMELTQDYCDPLTDDDVASPLPPPAPYLDVHLVAVGWTAVQGIAHDRLFLAIHTRPGWFFVRIGDLANPGGTSGRPLGMAAVGLTIEDVGATSPVAIARVSNVRDGCDEYGGFCYDDERIDTTLCGVDREGIPSCTTMSTSNRWDDVPTEPDDGERETGQWAVTLRFPGGGVIDIDPATAAQDEIPDDVAIGHHLLVFP